jgi:hypothetical protein
LNPPEEVVMRNRAQFMLFVLLTTVIVLATLSLASAHERRQVGDKIFVVGWFVEPAFVGEKNGVDLHVTTGTLPPSGSPPPPAGAAPTPEPPPVLGVEKTLKVEVIHGAQSHTYDLRTVFRQPGRYTAHITPTREGDYRMRFIGTVDGMQVDQTFDSADGKFNRVAAIEETHFPAVVAGPDELSRKVESARAFGIIGTVLGALGLVLAGRASRRGSPTRP